MTRGQWLTLFIFNGIWSLNPVVGKWVLDEASPFQLAYLRYGSALITYVLIALVMFFLGRDRPFLFPRNFPEWRGIVAMGIAAFFFSPLLQSLGLYASGAVDNVLIISAEPLMVVVMAWLFLREKIDGKTAFGLGIACVGFLFLTFGNPHFGEAIPGEEGEQIPRWIGNLAILGSIVGEGVCSIAGRDLMKRGLPALGVFGAALSVGVGVLTVYSFFTGEWSAMIDALSTFSWKTWLSVFWLGPIATGLGYWVWIHILASVRPGIIAVTLYIQPVLGTVFGIGLLGEDLGLMQSIGGLLILLGTLFPLFQQKR